MLQTHGLGYAYPGGPRVLDGVDLNVADGAFVWACGPSGGGKSTLVRALAGLIPHFSRGEMAGEVLVDGVATRRLSVPEIARAVGVVLQDPSAQLFGLRAQECVGFALRNSGLDEGEARRRAADAMGALGIVHLAQRPVLDLSGGEQQLVALASALALQPGHLVLDEPFSELDPRSARRLEAALRGLNAGGRAVLVAEHRLELLRPDDRLTALDGGKLAADGPAERVVGTHLERMRDAGLRLPQAAEVARRLGAPVALSAEGFLARWGGRVAVRPVARGGGGEPLVRLRGVSFSFGRAPVLRGVDLEVRGGEMLFWVGPNGAGKTTLARLVAGLLRPTSGEVTVAGERRGRRRGPRPQVGMVFQRPERQLVAATVADEAPAEVLADMGLAHLAGRSPHLLSRGEKMRLALAGVLALRPRVVIVDEPTLGQDGRGIAAVMDRLERLRRGGTAVVVITHDLQLVAQHAQRVVHLEGGGVRFDGDPRAYFAERSGPPVVEITRAVGDGLALSVDELRPG